MQAFAPEQPSIYIVVTERRPTSSELRQISATGASIKFIYDYHSGLSVSANRSQIGRVYNLKFVRDVFSDTERQLSIMNAEILTHVEGRPGAFPQVTSAVALGWKHPFGQTDSGVLPGPATWQPINTW